MAQDDGAADSDQKLVAVRVALLEANGELHLKDSANITSDSLNQLIAKLKTENVLAHYQFFNLAALEHQEAIIQTGRMETVLGGRMISPRGGGSRSGPANIGGASPIYRQEETSSMIEVNSDVREDGKIVVELTLESSRLVSPKPATDEDPSAGITPPAKKTMHCRTTVILDPGVGAIIAAGGAEGDEESSRDHIIVSATAK